MRKIYKLILKEKLKAIPNIVYIRFLQRMSDRSRKN